MSEKQLAKAKNNLSAQNSPLGKSIEYTGKYQPSLLFPIARQEKRDELGLSGDMPFSGEDIWNAYELSWLNSMGMPQVAIGEFRFPASSPNIVESKSFKLYLNSFNQTKFNDLSSLQNTLHKDLSDAVGSQVKVIIRKLDAGQAHQIISFEAHCIDDQIISVDKYNYNPKLLRLNDDLKQPNGELNKLAHVSENLCSHLLKSNCLITSQPDWASVMIQYKGLKICHASLLKYLVSFRTHNEFHEQCVERIFIDILQYCQPEELTVYARYTRRGGLDINPWRSNCLNSMENIRLSRQ